MNAYQLGFIFIISGLFIWGVILFILRSLPRWRMRGLQFDSERLSEEAMAVIHEGGRVYSINQPARELFRFNLHGKIHLNQFAGAFSSQDRFLEMCANEGKARLSLRDGRAIEVRSFPLKIEQRSFQVLTFEPVELVAELGDSETSQTSLQSIQNMLDISREVNKSRDLMECVTNIMEQFSDFISAGMIQITLLDIDLGELIVFQMTGTPGTQRQAERLRQHYTLDGTDPSLASQLVETRKPILIDHAAELRGAENFKERKQFHFESFLGVPLVQDGLLIGTLSFADERPGTFSERDQRLLMMFSEQMAISLMHSYDFDLHNRQAVELDMLARFTESLHADRDTGTLYGRLVNLISSMFDVNQLGFLIYNPEWNLLQAQIPFYGLSDLVAQELYKMRVLPQSAGAELIEQREVLVFHNAPENQQARALGMDNIARAAGLQEVALFPLISSGQFLGFMQAAWYSREDDAKMELQIQQLAMISQPIAPVIESSLLLERSRQRATRFESLQRLTAVINSTIKREPLFEMLSENIAANFSADAILLFVLNNEENRLALEDHYLSEIDVDVTTFANGILVEDPQFSMTVTSRGRSVYYDDLQEQSLRDPMLVNNLLPFYLEMLNTLEVRSAMALPISIHGSGLGELWVLAKDPQKFRHSDLQTLQIITNHLSGFIERERLSNQTDVSLRKRVDHLTALRRITVELSTTLDFDHLVELLHTQALRITNVGRGTILRYDMQYAYDETPSIMKFVGDQPDPDLDHLIQQAIQKREQIYISDTEESDLPVELRQEFGSLLVAPIFYQNRAAGMLILKAHEKYHFDSMMLEIMESLISQTAIAIGNAIQYERQKRRGELLRREMNTIEGLESCFKGNVSRASVEEKLQLVVDVLREITPFRLVSLSRYHPETGTMDRFYFSGDLSQGGEFIQQESHDWETLRKQLTLDLMVGTSYYVSQHRVPVVLETVHMRSIDEMPPEQRMMLEWYPNEIFANLIFDEYSTPLGMIQMDCPDDHYRPDQPSLDAMELFSAYIASIFRASETLAYAQDALKQVRDTLQHRENDLVAMVKQEETLQRRISQYEDNVDHLMQHLDLQERCGKVILGVARNDDLRAAYESFAADLKNEFNARTVLLASKQQDQMQLLMALGEAQDDGVAESLFGQYNPLRESLLEQKTIQVPKMESSNEWHASLLMRLYKFNSFVCVPIAISPEHSLAALMLFENGGSPLTRPEYTFLLEQLARDLTVEFGHVHAIARFHEQVENLNVLLKFSQKLSSAGPDAILDHLLESVFEFLPEAEGCWVALRREGSNELDTVNARGYIRPEELLNIHYQIGGRSLVAKVFAEGAPLNDRELDFPRAYPMNSEELMSYRHATGGRLPVSSLFVPISLGQTTLGVITLDNFNDVGAFDEHDQATVAAMAQQTALVLENLELYQEGFKRAEQLEALSFAVQEVSKSPLRSAQMIEQTLGQMGHVVHYDRASLWIKAENRLRCDREIAPEDGRHLQGSWIEIDEHLAFLGETAEAMNVRYLPDDGIDTPFGSLLDPDCRTHLIIPLLARSELMGMMLLEREGVDMYHPSEQQIARAYASQAAVALHNAFLYEESMNRAQMLNLESERLTGLNEFALQLGGLTNLEQVYNLTLQHSSDLLGAPVVAIVQMSRHEHMMLIAQKPESELGFAYGLDEVPLFERLWSNRSALLVDDVYNRDDLGTLVESYFQDLGTRSLLIVPLISGSNFWGWMWVQSPRTGFFDERSLALSTLLANHVSIALMNATNFYESTLMRENLEKRIAERTAELEKGIEELDMLSNNLQAILSSMADGVLVADYRARVIMTNSAAATILRTEQSLLMGMRLVQLPELLRTNDEIQWVDEVESWIGRRADLIDAQLHSQLIELNDGRILFVQGAAVLQENSFLGTVTIIRDITAEAVADRMKSEFVTNISHELRTPITAIKGAVEVVLTGMAGEMNPTQEQFLSMAERNCDRLQTLIDDILVVSQMNAGEMEVDLQPVSLEPIVDSLVKEYQALSDENEKALEFSSEVQEYLPKVKGDGQRLRQSIGNLLSNAYRYTQREGKIVVRVRQRGNYLQVDVIDNGIGIPAEQASRIFERFYRGEDELVIATAGSGLGLSMTKAIIEMHGGEIWFQSSGVPGEGSTFSFTLPVVTEDLFNGEDSYR